MAVNESEALACMKLVVCLAKADGSLAPEERGVFEDTMRDLHLPKGTTAQGLLDGKYDAAALIAEITSKDARDAAFQSCFAMAYADRTCLPEEQAILNQIEKAWVVPKETKGIFGRMFSEAEDTLSWSRIQPIADPVKREAEITQDVRKYAILAGTLGLFPIPVFKLATELAVCGVQGKMVRDIGQYWGQETNVAGGKQLLAGMGVGQAGRIAVNVLLGFVPIAGSVIPAAANFASTWAVGRVANQFYANGGKLAGADLKAMFREKQKEGKTVYDQSKGEVEAKAKQNKATLDLLAADYKAGKITQAEYERKVIELK